MPYHVIHYPHIPATPESPSGLSITGARIVWTIATLKEARTRAEANGPALCKPGDKIEAVRVMDEWNADTLIVLKRAASSEEREPEVQA